MKKRWFVALLSAMLILAMGFAACRNMPAPGHEPGITGKQWDVLVVGSGITGSMAALAARDAGPNLNILVIEKEDSFGGNAGTSAGNFSNLIFGFGLPGHPNEFRTEYTDADWYTEAVPGGVDFVGNWSRGMYSPPGSPFPCFTWLRGIFNEVTNTMQFMINMGVPMTFNDWGVPRRWTGTTVGTGPGMMRNFQNSLAANNITVQFNCKAIQIRKDRNGVVNGVIATLQGDQIEINARKVILATGGFSYATGEDGLIAQWATYPGMIDVIPSADSWRTYGQGIQMAVAAGGAVVTADGSLSSNILDMDTFIYLAPPVLHPSISLPAGVAPVVFSQWQQSRNQVVVNNRGQRFTNEDGRRPQLGAAPAGTDFSDITALRIDTANANNADLSNAMIISGRAPYWIIYDSRALTVGEVNFPVRLAEMAEIAGNRTPVAVGTVCARGTPLGTHRPMASSLGTVGNVEAHLRALASEMGLNAADTNAFVAMMQQYNNPAAFPVIYPPKPARPDGSLLLAGQNLNPRIPLVTPPFFALQIRVSGATGSIGGVATTKYAELLNAAGEPIPNLFAAGEMANRWLKGRATIGGASFSLYSVMGRRAGTLAAEQLRN